MKKIALLLVFALLLPVFVGCQGAKVTSTGDLIPPQQAKAIALSHAGFAAEQVRDLDVELDRDQGEALHYDVGFEKDNQEYEYEIDALTGQILRNHKEFDN